MATTSAKRVVERQTTMQELAMPAASSNFSSWTSTEISSGSECNDAEGLVDVLLEASCDPLLIHSEELVDAAVRRKPLQKLRALRQKELDLASYMARREMSPFQERLNAITILPNVVFCLYFILAGNWIRPALGHIEPSLSSLDDTPLSCFPPGTSSSLWSWFHIYHYLPSIPPPAVTAIWLGITLHAPFSFLYHYKYAHQFTDSTQRVSHWSRRMDHSAIHACSALFAYATSGSFKYFLVNLLFNADCIYRQFQTKVSGVIKRQATMPTFPCGNSNHLDTSPCTDNRSVHVKIKPAFSCPFWPTPFLF